MTSTSSIAVVTVSGITSPAIDQKLALVKYINNITISAIQASNHEMTLDWNDYESSSDGTIQYVLYNANHASPFSSAAAIDSLEIAVTGDPNAASAGNARSALVTSGAFEGYPGDIYLGGKYIEAGISGIGSFGGVITAPAVFHAPRTNNGENYFEEMVGFNCDIDGYGIGNPASAGDFFLPGTYSEYYTIGYGENDNKTIVNNSYAHFVKNSKSNPDPINGANGTQYRWNYFQTDTQKNLSAGTLLKAETTGKIFSGTPAAAIFDMTQTVSFDVMDKFMKIEVKLKNRTTGTLNNVYYMRSVDADIDVDYFEPYYYGFTGDRWATQNSVISNPSDGEMAVVRASSLFTDNSISLISGDSRARAILSSNYNFDPYDTTSDGAVNGTSDDPIALRFQLGNMAPNEEKTFVFYYSLDNNVQNTINTIALSNPEPAPAPSPEPVQPSGTLYYNVMFVSENTSVLESARVASGYKLQKPMNPTKPGYLFAGWYKDAELTVPFDFNEEITRNTWLFAKWTAGAPKMKLEFKVASMDSYLTLETVPRHLKPMDVTPILREDRTLLPIRFVVQPLGGTIDWNQDAQKVTIQYQGTTIEMWIGNNIAKVNGKEMPIDPANPAVMPILHGIGRTMLPLRFVSEALGCTVNWLQDTQEVIVTR